jgi:hypothetical protein
MSRWNEIRGSLGFTILFPRFCLFVLLPCLILIVVPAPPAFPLILTTLQPGYVKVVLAVSLLFFGLSVAANLSVSRYLRLHQTPSSPYAYEAKCDPSKRSSYFRIQVTDKAAFRRLLRDLSRDHPREAIRRWLLVDDLLFVPPVLVLSLFLLVFMLVPWLVKFLWDLLKGRKLHPTSQT